MRSYRIKRTLIGRFPQGADLLESLTAFAINEDIKIGKISGIGATTHAAVAFYDQHTRTYMPLEFPGGMEILSLQGNISMRDGKPFVHAHIILADAQGHTSGGHLLKGTTLFACEAIIEEYEGEQLWRAMDASTGLFLWEQSGLL
jgi:predicted DNA-binding protein with PD1-like motif